MDYLYIVGAGGLGVEVLDLLKKDSAYQKEWSIAGFIDSRVEKKGMLIGGVPVIGGVEDAPIHGKAIYCSAIGDMVLKKQLVSALIARGCRFIPIVTKCNIGEGSIFGSTVIQLNASISAFVKIGDHVYLDTNCAIGHHVTVGDYSHIGRGVFVGGRAIIGSEVIIHAGALIASDIKIGNNVTIGLGSVVLRNVPDGATVLGNPARIIK
ncbi:acetyltransferase [Polynucleobacter cosmopolitanus]|uniref:PglD N-terminal domain-containing protein n=1 Tax=Polynucleobacter cosmopolitanus TaxID=351345 RepID=A0A229FW37_9BURK|nr:acetyltransferase [Polynucleobacter cosmopolitanus]OXL16195.1 hypothetical protein AOC33_03720 [Polynucleobacter cosmopolitanus]